MINYSFIIPHKNTPDLLRKCIDSIPHRDDVQIIVVDDNSDADKVDFEHFPGLGEKCTEVYLTKEGKGAGYARNVGLKHAVGKWIVFADADDWFMPDLIVGMDLYMYAEYDVIFFKGCGVIRPQMFPGNRMDNRNNCIDIALKSGDFRYLFTISSSVCKFISKVFIDKYHIFFHEVQWSNDVYFSALCAIYANQYLASRLIIYCATSTPNSLTTQKCAEYSRIRYEETLCEASLFQSKYKNFYYYQYWFAQSWLDLLPVVPWYAILKFPRTIRLGGWLFVKSVCKQALKSLYFFLKNKIIKKHIYKET